MVMTVSLLLRCKITVWLGVVTSHGLSIAVTKTSATSVQIGYEQRGLARPLRSNAMTAHLLKELQLFGQVGCLVHAHAPKICVLCMYRQWNLSIYEGSSVQP